MQRIPQWFFPVAMIVSWLATSAHVLTRLANLHATLAQLEQPADDVRSIAHAHALARR